MTNTYSVEERARELVDNADADWTDAEAAIARELTLAQAAAFDEAADEQLRLFVGWRGYPAVVHASRILRARAEALRESVK